MADQANKKQTRSVIDVIRLSKIVDPEILDKALEDAKNANEAAAGWLLKEGIVTKNQMTEAIASTLNAKYVDLLEVAISPELSKLMPANFARQKKIVPLGSQGNKITVAVPVKFARNIDLNDSVRLNTGFQIVEFVVSPQDQIEEALKEIYRADEEMGEIINDQQATALSLDSASVDSLEGAEESVAESDNERFVKLALLQAVEDRASDIIFESTPTGLDLRYRIDGTWHYKKSIPKGMSEQIISAIKLMASLNITIKMTSQDGRMSINHNGNKIDFRINSFPIQDGENITMRIIDNSQANLKLEDLGFSENNLKRFMSAIKKPQGLILVTGPTGSGKSVTLYSGLNVIASPSKNTYTIEDPIEYRIENVKQSQINKAAKWDYPRAIESFMRSAPDNILVGEIRNLETAKMALEAGMTGHLVLSTLHTNSAAEAAARLIDMGADPDVVSMTLTAIVAQRLVRKLCSRCKIEVIPDPDELVKFGYPWEPGTPLPILYGPSEKGCRECKGLGYRGRTAAHEILLVDDKLKQLINKRATASEIEAHAMSAGMTKMLQDGFRKVADGMTTIEEVFTRIAANN